MAIKMKNQYINAVIILVICCLLLPFAALPGESSAVSASNNDSKVSDLSKSSGEKIKIYMTKENKIKTVSTDDYVIGSLFYAIPADYNTEAVKAQAVVSYTYAVYCQNNSEEKYDLTDDPDDGQGYLDEAAAKEKFGNEYESCLQVFKIAAEQVKNYIITYEDKPIYAVSHPVSAGKTETGFNAFGEEYPYLTEVESVGDLLSSDYFSTFSVSTVDFFEKLKDKGISDPGEDNYEDCIGSESRSDSGTVLKTEICGKTLTGREIRDIFGINSANFDLKYDGSVFVFTVRGNGHLAGMSRYGANYMASLGSTFAEILSWYYPNCEMVVVEE